MTKAIFTLETLACPTCMQKIESAVKHVDGVDQQSVKVLFNASKVKTNFDKEKTSIADIKKAIEDMGYSVLKAVEKDS
ncbi:heavy-metal-associated domain-containing protein [Clostridium algidicarnis]|uniref:heavy-metal-associated domain-containing protein n=1 Tax=Clostridium algidicarnis TaxID=37659 RepID=UPI00049622C2|nr:heavy-metal-associated domain-containing protein [Clostridium algidicarnis]